MRVLKKPLVMLLALLMVVTLVPAVAYATTDIDAASYYYNSEAESGSKFTVVPSNKYQNGPFPDGNTLINLVSGDSFEIGATVTVKKYPGNVNDDNKVYSCVGFAMSGSNMLPDESKVHLFGDSDSYTYTIQNSDIAYSYVTFYFLWQELSTNSVTYDFSGPNNTTVYPVIAKYELNDKNGPWEPPYSLSYFTVPRNTEWVNLIGLNDAPKMFPYAHSVGVVGTGATNALKDVTIVIPDDNKLTVNVAPGDPVTFPRLAQHRNVTMNPNDAQSNEIFYPVVGYVAVGTNGKYYELTGWNVNGEGAPVATGLYGDEYTPSGNVTLKAVWTEVKLTDTTDLSAIPEVPLLTEYEGVGPVKLSQKLPSEPSYVTGNVITGKDGRLDYEVSLKFSDLFNAQDMPWRRGGDYFKPVDNNDFADVNIDVNLDENLVPYADTDGYTTITIYNASLKITGIEIDGVALTADDVTGTQTADAYNLKVKLKGAKEFSIDFDWKDYSDKEMNVQIPVKVEGTYTGDITGTTVKVTGEMHFDKAHDASKESDSTKADFSADEFVRYLLAYDETWFNKYGGENMTLTQMLQAARDVQAKLNKFELSANTLTATVSPSIEKLELDQEAVTVNVNGTVTVTPVFTPDTVTNKAVTWSVDDAEQGIVKVENGVITGLKPGKATVICTSVYDPTQKAEVTVTVNGVVYVEPTTGGTVSITGDDVTPITGADAYSVSGEVTVAVTPNSGNSMAGEKPSVYYYEANGDSKSLEDSAITKNADGTFTFTMPEGVSTVYVSVVFVIDNGNGKTVIGNAETVVEESGIPAGYTDEANKLDIEMTPAAQEEMLRRVAQEGGGTKYNDQALRGALSSASVSATGNVYRHIQTRANIEVTSYEENSSSLNTGKLVLDIEYQYRVVASTVADPDKLDFDGTKNAAIVEPGSTDGWREYESTEATYIVVPVTPKMGEPGEWIKATHTHTHGDTPYTHYLKIANDNTVTYVNLHEGYSPFTFEALRGVKDIRIENNGETVGIETFSPGTETYSAHVSEDISSVKFTPDFMKSETGATARDDAKLVVNDVVVTPDNSAGSPTYTVELKEGNNTLTFTYVVGSTVDQTYTISIYRGTRPVPPSPSTYTVKTEEVENATVETSASSARAGETVTVTVTPAESYHVSGVTVTAANGAAVEVKENEDGTYTFTMPASNVTVTATVYKCPSLAYSDLDVTQWYHPYVDYAITHDLMEGVGDGVFAPEKTVTRAQMAGILWNLEGQPVVNYLMTFTDVPDGKWYTEAIRWAASEGIISGFGDGTFRPEDTITREQMAAMLYFYEQKLGSGGFTGDWEFNLTFDDAADISPWAREAVAWCTMKGVITGSDNKFNPSGSSKRAHLATILALYDQLENN